MNENELQEREKPKLGMLNGRDAGFDGSNEPQFTALCNDGKTILTMVVDEMTDAVKDEVFGPDLKKKKADSKIKTNSTQIQIIQNLICKYKTQ